jgi:hypothetical protein
LGDGRRIFYRTGDGFMAADVTVDATGDLSVVRARLFEGDFFGGPESPRATYDVHPNGDRFVLARAAGRSRVEIVVWMDWMEELKEGLGR